MASPRKINFLFWNCRGLGTNRKIRDLGDLVSRHSPMVIGLIETKTRSGRWPSIRKRLNFLHCFFVNPHNSAGGLAVLWREGINLTILNFSFYHIDFIIHESTASRYTLFYGAPETSNRKQSWNLLRQLSLLHEMPWCVCGDFNEILKSDESTNMRRRQGQIDAFREAIDDCQLIDLGFKGCKFTYSNRRQGAQETKCRLDRALANSQWLSIFPNPEVHHLSSYTSDHNPLLLLTKATPGKSRQRFHFEMIWYRHRDFSRFLSSEWTNISQLGEGDFVGNLQRLSSSLRKWNMNTFGHIGQKVQDLRNQLENVKNAPRTQQSILEEQSLITQLDEWLYREELLWKQRSRIDWAQEGDSNTRFFHTKASSRKLTNRIDMLEIEGQISTHQGDISRSISEYFRNLYSSSASSINNSRSSFEHVIRKVSEEDNLMLTAPYTAEDVKKALFQLHPTKAPGPDGFPALFFQRSWLLVRDDFTRICLEFLNEGVLDPRMNETLIVLIPKTKSPKTVKDYRPISLCNIIMRTISKAIVLRLQVILDKLISSAQSAFVKGRRISDNIFLAHEITHYMKSVRSSRSFFASLKLDISKAFDKLEWTFIHKMMHCIGFHPDWTLKVMTILQTVSYKVLINGSTSDKIIPTRGLRQGDPLSPYIFILCSEWLSNRIHANQLERDLFGVQIARNAPKISHLFFADDSLFYVRVSEGNASRIRNILLEYECISGQAINSEKSEAVFSRNTPAQSKSNFLEILGVREVPYHSKYLGLPINISHNKQETFKNIQDNFWARTNGWSNKCLSIGGKEIMIKSVLAALPNYLMSCYLLPDIILSKIASHTRNFWWNHSNGRRSCHWISAKWLEKDKDVGGMGFKDFKKMNFALLARQAWRIHKNPNLLISRVLKAKYFPTSRIYEAELGSRPSYAWRSIHKSLVIIQNFISGHPASSNDNLLHQRDLETRMAYSIARQLDASDNIGVSDPARIKKFWNCIWKLNLPRKVKIFCWKAFHNGLATGVNMIKRKIVDQHPCKCCGVKEESDIHIFLRCWWSICLWTALDLSFDTYSSNFHCFADWIYYCFHQYDATTLAIIIAGAWMIWFNRNTQCYNEDRWTPMSAAMKVKAIISIYRHVKFNPVKSIFSSSFAWIPPPPGYIKMNTDGAFERDQMASSFGWTARDAEGIFLNVAAGHIANIHSSIDAEATALLEAMSFARQRNWKRVIFESDCASLVESINCLHVHQVHNQLMKDCISLLSFFDNWILVLVRREANEIPDKLARRARLDRWSWTNSMALPFGILP